jgi:hypothetical protein
MIKVRYNQIAGVSAYRTVNELTTRHELRLQLVEIYPSLCLHRLVCCRLAGGPAASSPPINACVAMALPRERWRCMASSPLSSER